MKHWQQPTEPRDLAAAIDRISSPAEMLECLVANYALAADRYGQHQTLHDQIWQRMQQLVDQVKADNPTDRATICQACLGSGKAQPEPLDWQLAGLVETEGGATGRWSSKGEDLQRRPRHRWSVQTASVGGHAMQWLQCSCGWESSAVTDPNELPTTEWTAHTGR